MSQIKENLNVPIEENPDELVKENLDVPIEENYQKKISKGWYEFVAIKIWSWIA